MQTRWRGGQTSPGALDTRFLDQIADDQQAPISGCISAAIWKRYLT